MHTMKNTTRIFSALIALLLLMSTLASCTPASVLGLPLLLPIIMGQEDPSNTTTTPEETTPEDNTPPAKPSVFEGIVFDDPAVVLPLAYALEKGKTLEGTYTLMGQIIESAGYNSQYGDISVTIAI